MFSKIIAVAIVLMMIPMAVSATVTTAVSGSVVDGTVTGSSSTQSDMYGDMHTLSGAQSDVMGSGTLNYASTTVSDGSDTQTAYFGSVAFGNLIGSASSFITQVTAPVSNMLCSGGVCKPTDASTQSTTPDKTCTEKTYSTTVSGSNYAIDNGYIESSTGVSSGTKAFTFTTAKASGSVAMFGSYNAMSGGCPFISSASGSSNYRFTGKVVNFNGAYING